MITTITVHSNGIAVETAGNRAVYEDDHKQTALQDIMHAICDIDCGSVTVELGEGMPAEFLHRMVTGTPITLTIETMGSGFVITKYDHMVSNAGATYTGSVYEAGSMDKLMQYIATVCFPGTTVSLVYKK